MDTAGLYARSEKVMSRINVACDLAPRRVYAESEHLRELGASREPYDLRRRSPDGRMTASPTTSLTVAPVAGALGATVTGIDLTRVSEAAELADLRRALADHLVVFLPEQDLDLDDLERVTDLLGGRDVTPFVDPLEDRPYVIRVIKEPSDALNFANAWHSDLSYLPGATRLHAAARLGRARPRRRHGVVEPVPGLRDALARPARRRSTA